MEILTTDVLVIRERDGAHLSVPLKKRLEAADRGNPQKVLPCCSVAVEKVNRSKHRKGKSEN